MLAKIADMPVIWDGPENAENLFILAHGAGAPMDTYFMDHFARALSDAGIRVLRFEFPYMALRRDGGSKRPPNTQKVLLESWKKIIEEVRKPFQGNVYIGGKSMGGRMASMIADECAVDGLICLGYPFYAPGKSDKPRIEHLAGLGTTTIILQGERDSMGSKEVVSDYTLSDKIQINWLSDGDHGLKPRKKSGFTEEENLNTASKAIIDFIGK
ncbi:alpha/beta fold hydrolase [Emcibacteraceae bacterium Y4]|nr:alpha/beta fold hydrolase [Pseudemcibacter aquimaris]MCC3861876.1 alpha/beta fold hydrolase [Pseudemcibacter aquimaris]WDU58629.1 alpha/beta fold hydrolase [Pseudemcibacter aquimaris]